MGKTVCCPCGNPLDCDSLELIVSISCARCSRELTVELENARGERCHAVLTILEGPYWIGEQFVLPIEQDLVLGRSTDSWLSLDADEIGQVHCKLKVDRTGRVSVEDRGGPGGTWIDKQRVMRGAMIPSQTLRVGEFRFRLDLESLEGARVATVTTPLEQGKPLPMMHSVTAHGSPLSRLVSGRFGLCRALINAFGWLTAAYHVVVLHAPPHDWPWYSAIPCAASMVVLFTAAGRRVALVHPYMKYGSLAVLLFVAIADLIWAFPVAAGAALGMAGVIVLLMIRIPSEATALIAAVIGLAAAMTMGIASIQAVSALIASLETGETIELSRLNEVCLALLHVDAC